MSTDNFTNAHFPRPLGRSRGREVHEIDTRDQENKKSNGGKGINGRKAAVCAPLAISVRRKVNISQWLERQK